jgi:2-polyprenyl-3-methyl-5-hydroxy-6-metoxy-1,4-benzoquinol methylase/putative flippase GtrA
MKFWKNLIRIYLSKDYSKFFLGGIVNYSLKLSLTFLLTEVFQLWYLLSYSITLLSITIFSFYYNNYITYNQTKSKMIDFVRYVGLMFVFILLDILLVNLLTNIVKVHYLWSIVLVTTFLFPAKFYGYKRLVFSLNVKKNTSQMTGLLSPLLQLWRFKKVLNGIKGPVLEIGCGKGELIEFLPKQLSYCGIDIQQRFVTKAKELYPDKSFLCFKIGGKEKLPVGKFNSIILLALVEHLENPRMVIDQLKNHLLPDGRIIITTPTPKSDKILQIGSNFGLFSKEALEEHHTYFTKKILYALFKGLNIKVIHYRKFQWGLNQIIVGKI